MANVSMGRTGVQNGSGLKRMTATAVFAALITVFTAFILHIPIGIGGYVHLGDALIYLAASLLPLSYACAAGAIGGGMADILTAPEWAPATILIKMLICIPFTSKNRKFMSKRNIAALVIALVINVSGYFIAQGILYGFDAAIFTAISGNMIQSLGSAAVYVITASALDRVNFKQRFAKDF